MLTTIRCVCRRMQALSSASPEYVPPSHRPLRHLQVYRYGFSGRAKRICSAFLVSVWRNLQLEHRTGYRLFRLIHSLESSLRVTNSAFRRHRLHHGRAIRPPAENPADWRRRSWKVVPPAPFHARQVRSRSTKASILIRRNLVTRITCRVLNERFGSELIHPG